VNIGTDRDLLFGSILSIIPFVDRHLALAMSSLICSMVLELGGNIVRHYGVCERLLGF
jgi:hypothetical protein